MYFNYFARILHTCSFSYIMHTYIASWCDLHTIKLLSLSTSGLTLILFTSMAQSLECSPYSTQLYGILKIWDHKLLIHYKGQARMCAHLKILYYRTVKKLGECPSIRQSFCRQLFLNNHVILCHACHEVYPSLFQLRLEVATAWVS